jgi:Nucleotidyltransferase domain
MKSFKCFLENTTFQYHKELNKRLWEKEELKDDIRKHLMMIAKEWQKFAKIPNDAVKDIVMTGGNANFNYTKYSDIDIHLIVDKNKISKCDIVDEYLLDKKALWAFHHDIKVVGYPVELYAQDINEPTSKNQGVYSLLKNKWLKKPVKEKISFNDPLLLRKIKSIKHQIDFFIKTKCNDIKKMESFKQKLHDLRSASVRSGGEFSIENLAYKELRNLGYLDKFSNYIEKMDDHDLTLN